MSYIKKGNWGGVGIEKKEIYVLILISQLVDAGFRASEVESRRASCSGRWI